MGALSYAATYAVPRSSTIVQQREITSTFYRGEKEQRAFEARQARDRDIAAWNKAVDDAKAAKRTGRSRP